MRFILAVLLVFAFVYSPVAQGRDDLKKTDPKKKTGLAFTKKTTPAGLPQLPQGSSSSSGSSGGQSSTPAPAVVKYIEINFGADYISSTGYHLVLRNTSNNDVQNATLQCSKLVNGDSLSGTGAGGQVVNIPAGGTIEVRVDQNPGWCNGYEIFKAQVVLNGDVIGERGWSIPASAKQ